MSQRMDRVDELLRQEIGTIISRELSDPRLGFVTVTDVETSPDLRHARVWVSVIGQPDERKATLAVLGRAMPFIRRELGTRLRLKRIPDLHVQLDDSAERGTRVLHLLNELEAGHEVSPEAAGSTRESLPTPVRRLPHEGDAPPDPADLLAIPPLPTPSRRRRGRPSGDARFPKATSRRGPGARDRKRR
ncbi:MAG: 30S ribosome-binding factor RbfA [Chloroflexi bacterium]|nr:30S ribosome-binding factor RbfA [Chloroflexota bacterium]